MQKSKKLDLFISSDGLDFSKNEKLKQQLLIALEKNDFHFSDDVDHAIREQILSNVYYLNIIVIGEEKWNQVIRYIEMYQVIKKISKIKEEHKKIDFGKEPKIPPLIDRDINNLYSDKKVLNYFPAPTNIKNYNYLLINMIEIIFIILNHINELRKEQKEQERQERLSEIKKEFQKFQSLRFEMNQKDQKINEIIYDNSTTFLRFLLKNYIKFSKM